jgi:hypothetical protein
MIDIQILKNGHLQLNADAETQEAIGEAQADGRCSGLILWDQSEAYWTNGGFHPFDAGLANPFVGLTCAPCIAESIDVDDDGEMSIVGRLWWFPDYAVLDPVDVLKRKGSVIFYAA